MILRVSVKFIEMLFPLKSDYNSLQHHRLAHVIPIITEATERFGLFLLCTDPAGRHHASLYFQIPQAFLMRLLF